MDSRVLLGAPAGPFMPAMGPLCRQAVQKPQGQTWDTHGVPWDLSVSSPPVWGQVEARGCACMCSTGHVCWREGRVAVFLVGRSLRLPVLFLQPVLRAMVGAPWPVLFPSSQLPLAKSGSTCGLLPQPRAWATRAHLAELGVSHQGKAGGRVGRLGLRPWQQPRTPPAR